MTGDLERGYGDPVGTARAAWDAGLVGINFEDSTRAGLVDVDEQAAAIPRDPRGRSRPRDQRARRHLPRIGRGDVPEAAERGNAYLAAGADCIYPILAPVDSIDALVHRIKGPINVIAEPGTPPPPSWKSSASRG